MFLFIVFSVSLWCLFRAPMISFICFCVYSYSLFLLSWNFLSVSCMFCLTMSSIISMKFLLITSRISSFNVFLLGFVGFLGIVYFCFVGVWIWVSIFFISSEFCTNLFWKTEWFPFLFHLPIILLGTVSGPGLCIVWY
jgi:hypothetical protein